MRGVNGSSSKLGMRRGTRIILEVPVVGSVGLALVGWTASNESVGLEECAITLVEVSN